MPNEKQSTAEKILAYLTPARGWIAPADLAKAMGLKRPALGYQLKTLLDAKRIAASGTGNARRYAALGTKPGEATETRATRATKKTKTKSRAKGPEASPVLPAPQANGEDFTIASNGSLSIQGLVKLNAASVRELHAFMTTTQPLWDQGA